MINVTRRCDICKRDYTAINVKYKAKGLIRRVFGKWEEADICDDCIDEIRKAVREKKEVKHD